MRSVMLISVIKKIILLIVFVSAFTIANSSCTCKPTQDPLPQVDAEQYKPDAASPCDECVCVPTNIKPSSQALCMEAVLVSCDKEYECSSLPVKDCIKASMDLCVEYTNFDVSKADQIYKECFQAIPKMTCEAWNEFSSVLLLCKNFLIEQAVEIMSEEHEYFHFHEGE